MPFERLEVGAVVLVCWVSEPAPGEIDAVLTDLSRVTRQLGRPPIFLSTNLDSPRAPRDDVRSGFMDNFPRLLRMVDELHLVPGGNAILRAIIRSSLTTALVAMGSRGRVFVHAGLGAALTQLESSSKPPTAGEASDGG